MASRSSRRRSPLVPAAETECSVADVLPQDAGQGGSARPAALCHSSSSTSDKAEAAAVGTKHKHKNGAEEPAARIDTSGKVRQVQDHPLEGACACCLVPLRLPCSASSCSSVTALCCPYGSGSLKSTSDVWKALEARAKRILPFTDGNFAPSPPPALLDKLTDELLVVVSHVRAWRAKERGGDRSPPRTPSLRGRRKR